MYDELVKRLREQVKCNKKIYPQGAPFETLLLDLAADAIEELSKQHEAQRQNLIELMNDKPRWISVEEQLPQICTNVLVAGRMKYRWEHKYFQFVDMAFFNEREFFETSNDWYEGQDEFEITHWMPLPPAPKEG